MTLTDKRKFKHDATGKPLSGGAPRHFKAGEIVVVSREDPDGTAVVLPMASSGGPCVVNTSDLAPA